MSYPLLRYAKSLRLLHVFVMKAQLKTILISSIFMLFSIVSYAQDNIDPPPPPAPPPGPRLTNRSKHFVAINCWTNLRRLQYLFF